MGSRVALKLLQIITLLQLIILPTPVIVSAYKLALSLNILTQDGPAQKLITILSMLNMLARIIPKCVVPPIHIQ